MRLVAWWKELSTIVMNNETRSPQQKIRLTDDWISSCDKEENNTSAPLWSDGRSSGSDLHNTSIAPIWSRKHNAPTGAISANRLAAKLKTAEDDQRGDGPGLSSAFPPPEDKVGPSVTQIHQQTPSGDAVQGGGPGRRSREAVQGGGDRCGIAAAATTSFT
ncbi:unnamed protein product [Merluccius merluccius]